MKGFLVFLAKNDEENFIKIWQFLEVLAQKNNMDGRSNVESKGNNSNKEKIPIMNYISKKIFNI